MRPVVFYDGDCGFCNRAVRWVASHDHDAFAFAPIGGPTFLGRVPEQIRRQLPDTIVVLTAAGDVLIKSAAARHVLATAGGIWRVAAATLAALPTWLADAGYDFVARHRRRLAAQCDLPPAAVRPRLLP